jgi:DNA-binding NtrC family response regulator
MVFYHVLLRKEYGHVATVAEKMNMQKRTLYRKLKKYNINLKEYQKW